MKLFATGSCAFLAMILASSTLMGDAKSDNDGLIAAFNNGTTLSKQARYAEAVVEFDKAMAFSKSLFGEESPESASLLFCLASTYDSMGQYAKAEPLFLRSIAIREAKLGKDDLKVAESLNNLAFMYTLMMQQAKAEPLFQRALMIEEAKLGKDDPLVATTLNNLGELYRSMGQYGKAEPLYLRSLEIKEAKLGKDDPRVATTLNNLGMLHMAAGRCDAAEPFCLRALAIQEAKLGKDHPDVALTLNNLGLLYSQMGQYEKAEPVLVRSLEITRAKFGEGSPNSASAMNNLALLYYETGQCAKAEPLYGRCLEIQESKLGKNHPDTATTLNNLAMLYEKNGQCEKAGALLQRSLEITKSAFGEASPRFVADLNNLAGFYLLVDDYQKAEPLFLRSLEIAKANHGEDLPATAAAQSNLAGLYAATGRVQEASSLFGIELQSSRRHAATILPCLSEGEQLSFLAMHPCQLSFALSHALANPQDPALPPLSAQWVLNGKGVTLEVLAERTRLVKASQDPQIKAKADALQAVREELASLTMAPLRGGDYAALREHVKETTAREEELSKSLAQATGQSSPGNLWVDVAAVRGKLPADAVLVEIAQLHVYNFKAKGKEPKWAPPHYVAWIVPPAGKDDVAMVDLGAASEIDDAVIGFRDGIAATLDSLKFTGNEKTASPLRAQAGAVARLVWKPIEQAAGKATHVIISPDGLLWLLPWAVLPDKEGKFLIEKRRISYVVSGRDLVTGGYNFASQGAAIMADPDYDLSPSEVTAETSRILTGREPAKDTAAAPAHPTSFPAPVKWVRLPATAVEANAVAPRLKAYVQADPVIYLGKKALKGVLRTIKSPKVLFLSTHGFFLEDEDIAALFSGPQVMSASLGDWRTARSLTPAAHIDNPLLRCGLGLAGANNHQAADQGDDGILTGLEIVGMDLRGTEMVVLSACETGLGKVRNGEGVAGLRQAFQIAGAKSVVATLWSVMDKETAELMILFFDHLAKGESKADALRNAQLAMIAKLQEQRGQANPFYWAAFTLTGDWR